MMDTHTVIITALLARVADLEKLNENLEEEKRAAHAVAVDLHVDLSTRPGGYGAPLEEAAKSELIRLIAKVSALRGRVDVLENHLLSGASADGVGGETDLGGGGVNVSLHTSVQVSGIGQQRRWPILHAGVRRVLGTIDTLTNTKPDKKQLTQEEPAGLVADAGGKESKD
jgi:hypothetical protein